jgi:hypothetical protein
VSFPGLEDSPGFAFAAGSPCDEAEPVAPSEVEAGEVDAGGCPDAGGDPAVEEAGAERAFGSVEAPSTLAPPICARSCPFRRLAIAAFDRSANARIGSAGAFGFTSATLGASGRFTWGFCCAGVGWWLDAISGVCEAGFAVPALVGAEAVAVAPLVGGDAGALGFAMHGFLGDRGVVSERVGCSPEATPLELGNRVPIDDRQSLLDPCHTLQQGAPLAVGVVVLPAVRAAVAAEWAAHRP